jgi:hypothetical protein
MYSHWRQGFGGRSTTQAKRLKDLKRGNAQLRKAIADLPLDPDNEPMWVRLYVLPIGDRWAATILADTADPLASVELRGMSFFGDTPADVERLALDYLGEVVAQT